MVVVAKKKKENDRPVFPFTAIIFNNYLLFPYMSLFGFPATMLQIPEGMHIRQRGIRSPRDASVEAGPRPANPNRHQGLVLRI